MVLLGMSITGLGVSSTQLFLFQLLQPSSVYVMVLGYHGVKSWKLLQLGIGLTGSRSLWAVRQVRLDGDVCMGEEVSAQSSAVRCQHLCGVQDELVQLRP